MSAPSRPPSPLEPRLEPSPALVEPTPNTQKFLQFGLGDRDRALVRVDLVAEIVTVRLPEILPVPQMRSCILGVYNWRGEMLWIVDLGELLGYAPRVPKPHRDTNPRQPSDTAIAIVVEWEDSTIGFVVPQVLDLETYDLTHRHAPDSQLFPPTVMPYLQGFFIDSNGDIVIVLDIAEVLRVLQGK
ncbi:Purine-binding chemotaxis protein [Geitlerinema sp. FC II]|uniref:chemotaxis protein CheW n=1 Tax=Baaleninema simplex TaxID=2862350 RepID=UPI000349E3A6|nr:chemotaxis protein CheW [Baaleninema simplex]MDC0833933.1 chemotaxis protein CheW [Geitlerinema sp. CS-897]PPT06917.1 Purine-binding chemotaxis protein [Geitlerinema sp. FC II]